MKKLLLMCACSFCVLLATYSVVDAAAIDELNQIMDSARIAEAHVFAPKTWKKAEEKAGKAKQSVQQGRKQRIINGYISEATEYAENALKATDVAKLTLQDYLPARDKAKAAKAQILVTKLYNKAELQFMKATAKVEKGDVKGGLKEAKKSGPLFDIAELEGIRVDILGTADKLIATAVADKAEKFALSTLNRARSSRTKANAIITSGRYNRDDASAEAKRAEYEASHATNIAQSVRSLNRNDQAWEKLMLVYEIQMERVGREVGLDMLPFDKGPTAASDSLISYIKLLQGQRQELDDRLSQLSATLSGTLKKINYKHTADDPQQLAEVLESELLLATGKISSLSKEIASEHSKLSKLESTHEQVSAELDIRKAKEEKFRKAKRILNPSEGEILFNSSNDIVLRLSGLSFDIGKSTLKDEHMPLLAKVEEIINMFPGNHLMVEGHTDATGDATTNTFLSEKRAFAVMQYLRQSLLIPADKVRSMGYGAERPVASNQNAEGRAKNRRIDIIIMR